MTKLGVITDGISRDFAYALRVLKEHNLQCAELQFLWEKEVGDLDQAETDKVKSLVKQEGVEVSCISRHIFSGLPIDSCHPGQDPYQTHLAKLENCIHLAQELHCPLVRIMCFRKEMILFGFNGADVWNVSKGAWEKTKQLLEPALELAEKEDITLVVETGNNGIITSAQLAKRMITELGSNRLKVLWDPANSLYCTEAAFPDGFQALDGILGHVHIKDVVVDIANATLTIKELGTGHLAPMLQPIASGLRDMNYGGTISLEAVYRPHNGTFEDGFRQCVAPFKSLFQ